jgi:hypothetical protein
VKRHKPLQRSPFKTRSQKMAAAGFTRRKTSRSAGGLMRDPEDRFPGVDIDRIHRGRYGENEVHAPQEKREPVRDEDYRRWVATLPCIRCGIHGHTQAAHPNQGRGQRQKADDTDCFPLCCTRPGIRGCHAEHDQLIGITLEERRQRELDYIAAMKAMRELLDPFK